MFQHLQRRKYVGLLGLVLLLAAGARFYGFTWGQPYALHVDESYVLSLVYRSGRRARTWWPPWTWLCVCPCSAL